jgi:two-component system phosphate regulon sensor histidine kinase PhoR
VLLALVPYVAVTVDRHQRETLGERLLAEARAAGDVLPWDAGLEGACARLATGLGLRVTVVARDGRVLCESGRPVAGMENHGARPEVREALARGTGRDVRRSASVGVRLLYAAWRQTRGKEVRVVRVAMPLTVVGENVAHLVRSILAGLAVAVLLGLAAALAVSRGMLRRIQRLVAFARALAGGDTSVPMAAERADDLGVLEEQVGEMARSVAATITELRVSRERLEAILRSMVEGVVVSDLDGRVVLMNVRAQELLDVPPGFEVQGRPLVEFARDPAWGDVTRDLADGTPVLSRDLTIGPGDRTLQLNAVRLSAADGEVFGLVFVLHDITEIRRLEVIRRDFVANVSHELRTPLTAMKGYAETLLGPAGDDRDTARRFLAVIDRHSERLGRLIEDLLALSDLELGRTPLRLAPVEIDAAVDDVLQIFAHRFSSLRVTAEIAPGTPPVLADGDQLRQVLINLVDNAVKYTPAGGQVRVRARPSRPPERGGMVQIAVEDTGIGIPARDIPRLTERFFRVDKARSRALGGTGLGLAIVKHIVQLHGGTLAITSAVGAGTTVQVSLPVAAPSHTRVPGSHGGRP